MTQRRTPLQVCVDEASDCAPHVVLIALRMPPEGEMIGVPEGRCIHSVKACGHVGFESR